MGALEAAHIRGYANCKSDESTNGILLNRTIHTLFDRGMILIKPDAANDSTYTVELEPAFLAKQKDNSSKGLVSLYLGLHGNKIEVPNKKGMPARSNFEWKYNKHAQG